MAEESYLRIDGVNKSFGPFQALRDIALTINRGEFVCFLGPSGCGKTTLLRIIAGLEAQDSGRLHQDGRDISRLEPGARDFGIVFQSYALFPNLTALENVGYGLRNLGLPKARIAARAEEMLDLAGISEQGRKYPAQLSGGQQQRVALARALAMSPGLLLLDEPLSALDARVRARLRSEIRDLQRRLGVTTIMVTHDQEEALTMADRIVVMNMGGIDQVGTPYDIYRSPRTAFVARFVGEMNFLPATVQSGGTLRIGSVELQAEAAAEHAEGSAVSACIRPEDVIVGGAGDRGIAATAESLEFLGSYFRVKLLVPGLGPRPLAADMASESVAALRLRPGAGVAIDLVPGKIKIFAADGAGPRD
ncbi:MAG: putative 2-aminoethylphosphonate ABC transporter ATP-binding protein [Alphaproteobacteria bacterium]|nr:putative 2-aminoethylphosphonate ABC transporter ATP-binding protein [Alphaproteobacteria bacterium]